MPLTKRRLRPAAVDVWMVELDDVRTPAPNQPDALRTSRYSTPTTADASLRRTAPCARGISREEALEERARSVPIGRMGEP